MGSGGSDKGIGEESRTPTGQRAKADILRWLPRRSSRFTVFGKKVGWVGSYRQVRPAGSELNNLTLTTILALYEMIIAVRMEQISMDAVVIPLHSSRSKIKLGVWKRLEEYTNKCKKSALVICLDDLLHAKNGVEPSPNPVLAPVPNANTRFTPMPNVKPN